MLSASACPLTPGKLLLDGGEVVVESPPCVAAALTPWAMMLGSRKTAVRASHTGQSTEGRGDARLGAL